MVGPVAESGVHVPPTGNPVPNHLYVPYRVQEPVAAIEAMLARWGFEDVSLPDQPVNDCDPAFESLTPISRSFLSIGVVEEETDGSTPVATFTRAPEATPHLFEVAINWSGWRQRDPLDRCLTLLHELAHVQYPHHRALFWWEYARLLDRWWSSARLRTHVNALFDAELNRWETPVYVRTTLLQSFDAQYDGSETGLRDRFDEVLDTMLSLTYHRDVQENSPSLTVIGLDGSGHWVNHTFSESYGLDDVTFEPVDTFDISAAQRTDVQSHRDVLSWFPFVQTTGQFATTPNYAVHLDEDGAVIENEALLGFAAYLGADAVPVVRADAVSTE
jgi:hypothetical protein